ncbi:tyrosine-type recombinase/integrase [Pseudoalteromonas sp. McH1-42]|uniref:phage integrase n=1 Tax=Pseudoalteromonas sp. McH1-42 TaxID=2917752 RepID=UPI001EF5672C|nr:tyrosine-type recombinase/integrase [Pseudoalteromonas sp. McH1-42]MCG7563327.1 tyrosine-type recombinase/integrase [Pseudoalteromonas sp. McH1-42]
MPIKKVDDGYYLDERPWGSSGKRIQKKFRTRAEAQRYLNYVVTEGEQKPWSRQREDKRRLSDIIDKWYDVHGRTYADPESSKRKLDAIALALGNPIASQLTANAYSKYRGKRLESGLKPKTANNDLTLLKGVYNKLISIKDIHYPNPIANIEKIKVQEQELAFLTHEDIEKLFRAIESARHPHLEIVTKICLSTGARISEACGLHGSHVIQSGNSFKVTFFKTKGKKNRSIPISKKLFEEIPKKAGPLFTDCRKAFERAIDRAGITLPDGQCTHVMRHTFASHFMMNGGNILVLQKILGHAKIEQTMIYAHFAPSHYEDAVRLNPLFKLHHS